MRNVLGFLLICASSIQSYPFYLGINNQKQLSLGYDFHYLECEITGAYSNKLDESDKLFYPYRYIDFRFGGRLLYKLFFKENRNLGIGLAYQQLVKVEISERSSRDILEYFYIKHRVSLLIKPEYYIYNNVSLYCDISLVEYLQSSEKTNYDYVAGVYLVSKDFVGFGIEYHFK